MPLLERYRSLPRQDRVLGAIGAVGVVVGFVLAVWWGLASTIGKPLWGDLAYDVRDDRHVVVTYQLTRPTDRAVECTVVAKEMNHGTVGTVTDRVPPGPERSVVRTVMVRTTSRAVMGEVSRCRAT